ncbi:MAG TPA: OsmC family protein [Thermoanaerobaculia bacterium]|nr:OsmC family protein [Thermoanaerobaculia bacterium]
MTQDHEPDARQDTEPSAARPGSAARVTVRAAQGDGLTTHLVADGHPLVADEPADVPGGHDSGPNPYGLLLAALGACTAMTLRLYADRKDWPLEEVRVELWHGRVHLEDCEECDRKSSRIDQIDVSLALEGPLDDEQRARLLEIAGRCPVHRTLTSETRIAIREDRASS